MNLQGMERFVAGNGNVAIYSPLTRYLTDDERFYFRQWYVGKFVSISLARTKTHLIDAFSVGKTATDIYHILWTYIHIKLFTHVGKDPHFVLLTLHS